MNDLKNPADQITIRSQQGFDHLGMGGTNAHSSSEPSAVDTSLDSPYIWQVDRIRVGYQKRVQGMRKPGRAWSITAALLILGSKTTYRRLVADNCRCLTSVSSSVRLSPDQLGRLRRFAWLMASFAMFWATQFSKASASAFARSSRRRNVCFRVLDRLECV